MPDEHQSNARRSDSALPTPTKLRGECWRVVEAQHKFSTAKITDTLDEQMSLERILEETKPAIPEGCEHLGYLLLTPFRYSATNPNGSRFRRPLAFAGVFYASLHPHTAIAETAFYDLLFYAESPATPLPANAKEYTAFSSMFRAAKAADITKGDHAGDKRLYALADYSASQAFADAARNEGFDAINYSSVRDPQHRANLALLSPACFTKPAPVKLQSWHLHLGSGGTRVFCENPRASLQFGREAFADDPRLKGMRWER